MNKNRKAKRYGWICPRCDKVHAPGVKECDCVTQRKWIFIDPMPYAPTTTPKELMPPYIFTCNEPLSVMFQDVSE